MNPLTKEIQRKVRRYGIEVIFLAQSQGWGMKGYNTLYVHEGESTNDVLQRVNKMISDKGELLLLKQSLER